MIDKYVQQEYEVAPWFAAIPQAMFRAMEKNLGWPCSSPPAFLAAARATTRTYSRLPSNLASLDPR